jgi:hypothetical protein
MNEIKQIREALEKLCNSALVQSVNKHFAEEVLSANWKALDALDRLEQQNGKLVDMVKELTIAVPDSGRYYLELKDKAHNLLKEITNG